MEFATISQLQLCSCPLACVLLGCSVSILRVKHWDGTEAWSCCLDLTFCLGWMSVWEGWKAKVITSKDPNATDANLSSSRSTLYRWKHRSNLSVWRGISTSSQAPSLLEKSHHKHGGHTDLKIHNLWKRVKYQADQTSDGVAVVKYSNV